LRVLRALDEEGQRRRSSAVAVRVANDVALYTLNQKRRELARMESDYGMIVTFEPNDEVLAGTFELERTALPPAQAPVHPKPVVSVETGIATPTDSSEPIESDEEEHEQDTEQATPQSGQPQPQPGSSRKRRRRRRGRDHTRPPTMQEAIPAVEATPEAPQQPARESAVSTPPQANGNGPSHGSQQGSTGPKRRRRRRRGPRDHVPGQAPAQMQGERAGETSPRPPFEKTDATPEFERRPVEAPRERVEIPIVTPNAPSEPVWSLSHEPARPPRQAAPGASLERPSPPPQAAPPQRQAERAPEPSFAPPTPAQSEPEPQAAGDQPQRKGWWQRPFRIRD
jgi:ribonuclease E